MYIFVIKYCKHIFVTTRARLSSARSYTDIKCIKRTFRYSLRIEL